MNVDAESSADRHLYRSRERGFETGGWRSRRLGRVALLIAAGVALLVLAVLIPRFPGSPGPTPAEAQLREKAGDAPADAPLEGRRLYALSVATLRGMPPEASRGTPLEIWVTWEPPLTEEPAARVLLRDVRVHRIVPAVEPNAAGIVLLDVAEAEVPDLMYGDRFGTLSAVVSPEVSPSP